MTNHPDQAISENSAKPQIDNLLWQYLQGLDHETVSHLSQPSSEVLQMMEHNMMQVLGGLSAPHFDVQISTSRENLGKLLASAMMNGYFLRKAEERMSLEQQFSLADLE